MTVDAFSFALDDCPAVSSSRDAFLLVALGNNSDAYGLCYPRQTTLMEKTRMKDRAVRDGLKSLEALGMILRLPRRRRDGSRKSDAYLLMGWPLKRENRRRGRLEVEEADGHPLLAELGLSASELAELESARRAELAAGNAPEQDGNDNRHLTPVASTGSKCRTNRHLTPDQPAADAGIEAEPSLEPSLEPKPPTPLEGEKEGFDLFCSVFPMERSGNVNLKQARSDWRKAVDALGPDAVLAAGRAYAAVVSKNGQIPCGLRRFLDLNSKRGLVRQWVPREAIVLEPAQLTDSEEHQFLASARESGTAERDIRRWAAPGAFRFHREGAQLVAVMPSGEVEFRRSFEALIAANQLSVWSEAFLARRQERRSGRGAA